MVIHSGFLALAKLNFTDQIRNVLFMTIIKNLATTLLLTIALTACGQKGKGNASETFQVWGNCGMCKKTIEKAAKIKGVETAVWDVDSKQMAVTYDSTKTNVESIQKAIAETGYDTPLVKGNDLAYDNLHGCCQYDRKPVTQ